MAATKTPGVAIDEHGHRLIDKQYRGTRIYARLGRVTQADAERWLDSEIVRVNHELEDASNRRLRFVDGAARYLEDSRSKRSVDVTALHIRLLIPYIGALELRNIHDATLQPFIARRIEDGVTMSFSKVSLLTQQARNRM